MPQALYANTEGGRRVTIADFLKAGKEPLRLSLIVGRNLEREIAEPVVNRPGLALTGFYEMFSAKRVQIIGHAEDAYLASLPPDVRLERVRALIMRGAVLCVYANGSRPADAEIHLAEELGAVLMVSLLPTRRFVAAATIVLERLAAPQLSLYGTMLEVNGLGVMIEGDPGLGKSETALGLIRRGHALISDDLTCIRKEVGNNYLFASASDATRGYMEIRGIGIVNVEKIFGSSAVRQEKRLDLIIEFKRLRDVQDTVDRLGEQHAMQEVLGVAVPKITIPVSAGRDLVNLVETAVMNQKLVQSGYDPVTELSQHLRKRSETTSK